MQTSFITLLLTTSILCTELTITNPWSESHWNSGETVTIQYLTKDDSGPKLDMISVDLMGGDPNDGLHILTIKDNIKVETRNITWKVEDLPENRDYFIRIGREDAYFFSHTFMISGTGKYQLPKKPVFIKEDDQKYNLKQDEPEASSKPTDSSTSNSGSSTKSTETQSKTTSDKESPKSTFKAEKTGKKNNSNATSSMINASGWALTLAAYFFSLI